MRNSANLEELANLIGYLAGRLPFRDFPTKDFRLRLHIQFNIHVASPKPQLATDLSVHSHYSLQYADGLAGPMTIYGPSSANYDNAVEPILMTDWNHRSAFEDWAWQPEFGAPSMTNILLNGKGRYNRTHPRYPNLPIGQPERYSKVFERGKRYLLRLINTSLDTTFVFSIDGHNLTVIGADFVPIVPYNTSSVLVAIGKYYFYRPLLYFADSA